ncbi:MAG: Arc family DNA-binding protein [Gemmatimonas sp.]
MADRKSFLLRVDRELLDAVQRWANHDLRSHNGQIVFRLRRALRDAGRAPKGRPAAEAAAAPDPSDSIAPDES